MRFLSSLLKFFGRDSHTRCAVRPSGHETGDRQVPRPLPQLPVGNFQPVAITLGDVKDRRKLLEDGITFRMKVVAVLGLTELPSTGEFESILQEVMADKPHKRKNKMLVEFHVVPSCAKVQLTRVLPQELLCDHPMDTIKFFCSSPRDKRVFFFAVSLPGSRKTACIILRTLKNDRTTTGARMCRALEYAQWHQRSAHQFVHMKESEEADRILATSWNAAHETAGISGSSDRVHVYEEAGVVSVVPHKELEEAETSHISQEFVAGTAETADVAEVYEEPLPCDAQDEEEITSTGLTTQRSLMSVDSNSSRSSSVSAESISYSETDEEYTTDSMAGGSYTSEIISNSYVQDEEDKKQITSTGLIFRMKVFAVLTEQAPICDFEGILQNVMADKSHWKKNKILVDFCVAPTRVHMTRVESGELLSENHMEVVEFFCSFPRDKRVFFYAIPMPNASKTLCVCLRTLKNDRTVTGERVCKALKFAQWFWMSGLHLKNEISLDSNDSSMSAKSIPDSEDYSTAEELSSEDQETVKLVHNDDDFSDDEHFIFTANGMELNINMSQLMRANSKLMFTSIHFGMWELSNLITMLGGSPLPPLKNEDYNLSLTDIFYPTAPNRNTSLQTTVLSTDGDRAQVAVSLATTPYELSMNETTSVDYEPQRQAHPSNDIMIAGGVSTEQGISTELGISTHNESCSSSVSAESIHYS